MKNKTERVADRRWVVTSWQLVVAFTAVLAALPRMGRTQSIAERVAGVRDGKVRMSFAAKEGVCGDGRSITTHRSTEDWEGWCEGGPVRVVLRLRRGDVVDLDTFVGGRWRAAGEGVDLGPVSAPAAAEFLLSIARRSGAQVGKAAIVGAVLADSAVVWPTLLAMAKDHARPGEIRRAAVFWLSQAAGDRATEGLEEIVDDDATDLKVREHAVFALSQRPQNEGVPALIRVARSHNSPRIRKKALFWLGQSADPRAIQLFEEILLQP